MCTCLGVFICFVNLSIFVELLVKQIGHIFLSILRILYTTYSSVQYRCTNCSGIGFYGRTVSASVLNRGVSCIKNTQNT